MEVFVSKGTDTTLRNNLIRILEDGVSSVIAVSESYEESDRVLGYKYSISQLEAEIAACHSVVIPKRGKSKHSYKEVAKRNKFFERR